MSVYMTRPATPAPAPNPASTSNVRSMTEFGPPARPSSGVEPGAVHGRVGEARDDAGLRRAAAEDLDDVVPRVADRPRGDDSGVGEPLREGLPSEEGVVGVPAVRRGELSVHVPLRDVREGDPAVGDETARGARDPAVGGGGVRGPDRRPASGTRTAWGPSSSGSEEDRLDEQPWTVAPPVVAVPLHAARLLS